MHRTNTALWSTTAIVAALIAMPAAAQDMSQPASPPDPTVEAQTSPSPDQGAAQTDDAVETAAGADQATTGGEEIVVTGLRRSLRSAQNIKRNSEQIVDAIVAEDIGKLPDVTVSDTAARIPGVQVERGGGEANRVLIRGLPDVVTTYNGREIFTAEARFVALQDFPAGGIAALEVFKSGTADMIEPGLAGLINVRSRRPFDFKGLEIAGGVRGQYSYQSRTWAPNGNLLLSNRWNVGDGGQIGALINFSYTQLHYLDSARFAGGFIETGITTGPGTGRRANDDAERASPNAFRFPDAVGIFYGEGRRKRPSINAAIQYRPNDQLEFYIDGLYQGFRNKVSDRRLFVPLFGDATFTNLVLDGNQAESLTVNNAVSPFLFQGATYGKTDTYQFGVGGSWNSGPWRVSADLARTDSKFKNSIESLDTFFASSPPVDITFRGDTPDRGVEFDFNGFDTQDPANFRFGGLFSGYQIAAGDDYQGRVDVRYETGLSFLPEIMAGFRHADRDGSFEDGFRFGGGNRGALLTAVPGIELIVARGGFRGSGSQPVRTWITPSFSSIRDNIDELRIFAGLPTGRIPTNPFSVFSANEKSDAVYGQVKYEFDLGGTKVDGNVGLRAVKTDFSIEDISGRAGNKYTDYLPNASARFAFGNGLQMRLAATQTRLRAGFGDLRPTTLNSPPQCLLLPPADIPPPESCFQTGQGGNPDLSPVNSNNYDASLEYYFRGNGFASVAVFRRDFKGFINRLNFRTDSPEFGPGRLVLNIPVNAGKGRIQGFEAQAQTFFDFEGLPAWARGFGAQVNLTYLDADQAIPDAPGGTANESFGIPDVSKWTYNLVGMYERGPITARLAYNFRTKYIDFFDVGQNGRIAGEFVKPIGRLDFSSGYTVNDNVTLTFDWSNILGKPFRNFRNYNEAGDSFPRDVRYEESLVSFGARFRL